MVDALLDEHVRWATHKECIDCCSVSTRLLVGRSVRWEVEWAVTFSVWRKARMQLKEDHYD